MIAAIVTPDAVNQSRITCSERVIVANVRTSLRQPRGPGMRTHTVTDALPTSSPVTRSNSTSTADPLLRSTSTGVTGGLSARTQTYVLAATITGTRGPCAKHIYGLSRTCVCRRRRTTRPLPPAQAAINIATGYTSWTPLRVADQRNADTPACTKLTTRRPSETVLAREVTSETDGRKSDMTVDRRTDTRDMLVVHAAFQREFRQALELVRGISPGHHARCDR